MLKVIVCVGAPGSFKTTWAKNFIKENPSYFRVNNDALRDMCNNSVWDTENEKLIKKIKNNIITETLKKGFNCIVDNINGGTNFKDIVKLVSTLNIDVEIEERIFFKPLEELIANDAKRDGIAKVGDKVVTHWFKTLGGMSLGKREARREVILKKEITPIKQNEEHPWCAVFDLDGTMCDVSHRIDNVYDATNCDKDGRHEHVVELCKLLHNNGYKIFFFSGREDRFKENTVKWIEEHFGLPYSLHMRESGNFENDARLKERLFETHIKDQYNCRAWVDDRLMVCKFVHEAGLPLFRVGDPLASF